ncbi:cadherin-AgCad1 [Anabrus simplex]|uniref:cadherin-AgCad1 n=1 Tax=Anabrus simplex TaxID=316456 RepID=UPI0035A344B1
MRRRKSGSYGGSIPYLCCLLLLNCMVITPVMCNDDDDKWSEPYFLEGPTVPGVQFIKDSSQGNKGVVNVDENLSGVVIAMLNYKGATKPSCTDGGSNFNVDQSTAGENWLIHLIQPQDYEASEDKRRKLDCQIGIESGTLWVILNNLNDNEPVVEYLGPEKCLVDEDYTGPSDCKIKVTDMDGLTDVTASSKTSGFSLNKISTSKDEKSAEFLLNVDNKLDYETTPVRSTTILANDNFLGVTHSAETLLVVWVNDLPNKNPRWLSVFSSQSINEKECWDYTFSAEDGDVGINADISYKLVVGNRDDEKYFQIDENSGVFSVGEINRDVLKVDTYKMKVIAYETDDPNSSVEANITILVNDINDNIPEISPDNQAIKIDEETSMTLTFENPFSVTDQDLGVNAQFKLKLEENEWSSAFLLIPDAGYQTANISISVVNPSALDYEDPDWRKIFLKMIATEQEDPNHTSFATIDISLINRNDEFPEFDLEVYDVTVLEDVQIGYTITTVNAIDPDEDDTVTYSLTQRMMMINSNTGEVTVSAENAFDFERQQNMMVQVTAIDEANHRSYTQINITIEDVNDEAPTLYLPAEQLEIEEHSENDFDPVISATDPDSNCNLEFSIDWEKSSATKQGRRITNSALFVGVMRIEGKKFNDKEWHANLVVNNKDLLDWEEFDTLYLIIAVNDTNTDPKYAADVSVRTGTLPLTILDINDNPPIFTESSKNANLSVLENSDSNKLIGSITATDRDSEENGKITYEIVPVEIPAGMVVIDEDSGDIRTGSINIDYEEHDEHSYIVYAYDGNHTTSLNITIYIEDQNDNSPIIIEAENGNTISIPENTHSQNITIINATDADTFWKYCTLTYMFYDERDDNMLNFQIANDTGLVSVRDDANLDRESQLSYSLTFIVRDNYMDGIKVGSLISNPTTITVKLTDVNDQIPEFKDFAECYISALENLTMGESIFSGILAEDKDEPGNKNSQFHYFLESDEDESDEDDLFSVETVDPEKWIINITTKQDLTGKYGKYNVTIGAIDHGDPPLNSSKSYIICVTDLNDNPPVIEYPEENMSLFLHSTQLLNSQLKDIKLNPIQDFQATDADDSSTNNGLVTFSILGNNATLEYFKLINSPGTARLVLYREPPSTENIFELTLIASDNGEPKLYSEKRTIKIVIVNMDDIPPKFEKATQVMTIPENTIDFRQKIYEAEDANNKGLTEEDEYWQKTLYNITGGNTEGIFKLDKNTGELTLTKELDYEQQESYSLTIQAYTFLVSAEPDPDSLLHLTIQVEDENDMPPQFEYEVFTGIFSTTDKYYKEVLRFKATDVDTMDTPDKLNYSIIPDSMTVSHDSLKSIQNSAFDEMKDNSLRLAITPSSNLQGYFHFKVEVRDSMSPPNEYHMDTAEAKIYVISSSNVVKFNFLNSEAEVNDRQSDITSIFGDILQCVCGVDKVEKALNENGKPLDNETVVDAHFVDDASSQPIEKDKIIQRVIDNSVYRKLRNALALKNLDLVNFAADNPDSGNSIQEYLQTILICVSAVLGVMVIVLFVAFFVRTRTLNKRLDKLSTTKFGSQDSGLNRVGIAVPNTNRHAVEGSNPVWNEDVVPDYDNMSQGSGDSDLIGIEDSPEFNPHYNGASDGVTNGSYVPDHELGFQRRASLNPLSNLAGDSGVRSVSMNVQSPSFDSIGNNDHMASNSNFIFRRPDSVPATEL